MKVRIIKEGLNLEGSQIGDIVEMNDKAYEIAFTGGVVENYEGEETAKHVLILADPQKTNGEINKIN